MNDDGISTATDLSNSLAAPNFFEIDIVYFFLNNISCQYMDHSIVLK